ncbi:MAG: hypothetical protein M1833_004199 [Piccolia ochrophora]|nr:MAG: hypothetical protein M1833_004199 [Piccolia ochrophora]
MSTATYSNPPQPQQFQQQPSQAYQDPYQQQQSHQSHQPSPAAMQQGGQKDDFVDKGLLSVQKKYGGSRVDEKKFKKINEKITDFFRKIFEKHSGTKVPNKVSN